ncbi:MAG: hypothetical protein U1F43_25860 [Myxococcota bacterium]
MAHGQLWRSQGAAVTLGPVLGKGGEGTVHEVVHHPTLVAKLYGARPTADRVEKLQAMVALASRGDGAGLMKIAAWPVDALYDRPPPAPGSAPAGAHAAAVVGFLMPKVADHKELHKLSHPMDRLRHFPDVGFDFLVHVATNIARAFQVIHERGIVIGDVNESGVMVHRDGTVKLIDTDSMQLTVGARTFTCDVGKPEFQPPELLAQASFRGVHRKVEHDAFGLSVIIFQLLFFGWHPFAAKMLVGDQKTQAENISAGRFPYLLGFRSSEYARPPHALDPAVYPDYVRDLFERAFVRNRPRPSAAEWVAALMRFVGETRACPRFGTHAFHASLGRCPLCDLDSRLGFAILPHIALDAAQLRQIWGAVQRAYFELSAPLDEPEIIAPRPDEVPPEVVAHARKTIALTYAECAVLALALGLAFVDVALVALAGLALPLEAVVHLTKPPSQRRLEAEQRRRRRELRQARVALTAPPGPAVVQNYDAARAAYDRIVRFESRRQVALSQLQDRFFPTQLGRFLASHRIAPGILPGLGPKRVQWLAGHRIRSAADLARGIPEGLGEELETVLGRWLEFLQSQFMPDLEDPQYLAQVRQLDQRLEAEHARLVEQLKLGRDWLEEALPGDRERRRVLLREFADKAADEAEQAPAWAVARARFRLPRR